MYVVINLSVCLKRVHSRPHIALFVIKAYTKGGEGKVSIEEPNVVAKMPRVAI